MFSPAGSDRDAIARQLSLKHLFLMQKRYHILIFSLAVYLITFQLFIEGGFPQPQYPGHFQRVAFITIQGGGQDLGLNFGQRFLQGLFQHPFFNLADGWSLVVIRRTVFKRKLLKCFFSRLFPPPYSERPGRYPFVVGNFQIAGHFKLKSF